MSKLEKIKTLAITGTIALVMVEALLSLTDLIIVLHRLGR